MERFTWKSIPALLVFLWLIVDMKIVSAQCLDGQFPFVVNIIPDLYPEQTTWELYANDIEVAYGTTNNDTVCIDSSACVQFSMYDQNGNGICCDNGQGSYSLLWNGVSLISGGNFLSEAHHSFNCLPGSVCANPLQAIIGNNSAPLSTSYFAFSPSNSGMYSISSCNTTVCDTRLWLYGNCGQVNEEESNAGALYFNDNNVLCNLQADLDAYLIEGVTYIIRIKNLSEGFCNEPMIFSINFDGPLMSQLPIVKLTTLSSAINNDYKVPVHLQIINNWNGEPNFANQSDFQYEGNILAEWQGFTSVFVSSKKSYDFDLVDLSGNKIDTSLLGLPAENDWILKSEYSDNSLIRNTISYNLARRMGRYAPRTQQCELFLDGNYIGVYTLTEKVKRDNHRVDIAKLTSTDTAGSDLTGGYIIEINRNGQPGAWNSAYPPVAPAAPIEFKFVYPKEEEILQVQGDYIKTIVDSFENALFSDEFLNPQLSYRRWIDVSTFIDYQLISEFSMNVDSYQRSIYLHKEKDIDGGKLCIGPIWDFDLAFKGNPQSDWLWSNPPPFFAYPFWWSKFNSDSLFMKEMACRWASLRNNVFQTSELISLVDSLANIHLQGSAQRNFSVWQTLENTTYEEEINRIKSFINARFVWLDSAFAQFNPILPQILIPEDTLMCKFSIYEAPYNSSYAYDWIPGPEGSTTSFTSSGLYTLEVRDSLGCYSSLPMNVTLSIPNASFQSVQEQGTTSYTFNADNSDNASYYWNFGDNTPIVNGAEVFHTFSDTGVYLVTLVTTDSIGCSASFSENVSINSATSSSDNQLENEKIFVFPNPFDSHVIVNINSSLLGLNYIVFNSSGIVVLKGELTSVQTSIDLTNLPNGIYLFYIGDGLKRKIKLVKN
jgi:hypothetical protein